MFVPHTISISGMPPLVPPCLPSDMSIMSSADAPLLPRAGHSILLQKEDLLCAVCLSYLCAPRTLDCGHTFCCLCLLEATVNSPSYNTCPLCRTSMVSMDVDKLPIDKEKELRVQRVIAPEVVLSV